MAQGRLNMMPGNARSSQQGYPGAPQPGMGQPSGQPSWEQEPQPSMGQQPSWEQEPQPSTGQQPSWNQDPQPNTGQQPGWARRAQPGWAQEPTRGPGNWRGNRSRSYDSGSIGDNIIDSIGEDIAGAALGAAARFIGRRVGKKMQTAFTDKVMPAMAAKQEEMLRRQVEIAQRHPDLRACMTDQVVFLAGGGRVLPMKNVNFQMTVEESDALVAQLRGY